MAEPEELQRREDRRMRLLADHHRHRRRAEQTLSLDIPAGPAQHLAARGSETDEVGNRGAGHEAYRGSFRQAEQVEEPLLGDRFGRGAGRRGVVVAEFWPHVDVSQSAVTPTGCEPPITQPWKRGPVMA